jgi:hypothetical protein
MTDEDNEGWQAFAEIELNARLRNAMELFRSPTHGPGSKELPAASHRGAVGEGAAGLTTESEGTVGEELKRA